MKKTLISYYLAVAGLGLPVLFALCCWAAIAVGEEAAVTRTADGGGVG